jgi:predicted NBD/HSP70 family sugar kinase
VGCLGALAGGAALARDAEVAAREGRSAFLAAALARTGTLAASDVAPAATHGDPVGVQLLVRSASLVGEALAQVVNFFNPSLLLIGGGVAASGDLYLAEIRQAVLRRSLPLATRSLKVIRSPLGDHAGLRGSAFLVIDELLSRERLAAWLPEGTPAGRTLLTA